MLLEGLHAEGAVAAAAGKQEADAVGVALSQRAKQHVNRGTPPARLLKVGEDEVPIGDLEVLVGRDDVDVVRLHAHAPSDLLHGYGGVNL